MLQFMYLPIKNISTLVLRELNRRLWRHRDSATPLSLRRDAAWYRFLIYFTEKRHARVNKLVLSDDSSTVFVDEHRSLTVVSEINAR